ncbi:MAG TPA: hypothetical protein VH702_03365 [Vicinamibacterales bacterium]
MRRTKRLACGLVALGIALTVFGIGGAAQSGAGRKFFSDDPLTREPETQDASKVEEWDIDLVLDLAINLFGRPGDPMPNVRAKNVNTIDEIPDSNWFTNRILARPVTVDEAARGPLTGNGPAPGTWTITRPKEAGAAPGFTMQDAKGETWFVSFDAEGHPEGATGAILVANKIFWTLGYWQIENHLIAVKPDELVISETAMFRPPSGVRRRMRRGDLDDVLRRSHRSPDGTYRAIAGRGIPGRPVGGFKYHGTRPDDPNDIVPHEHRRELRALKVFGAWTNLVDMKAGNTLDTVITENGRGLVRHYLQDVGSTLGSAANGPHAYDEGWAYLYEGGVAMKKLVLLGFPVERWRTVDYDERPGVGRFEGTGFDPTTWKPRVPTGAFLRARADDDFWAARRVMAFSDEMIRAIAKSGQYTDPEAERLIGDVLIQRRDKIGQAYLNAVSPLVNFALDNNGRLTFDNAAVVAKVATGSSGYSATWSQFNNETNQTTAIGTPTPATGNQAQAPAGLPTAAGSFEKVQLSAAEPTAKGTAVAPVDVYFRRAADGWRLVGVERLP